MGNRLTAGWTAACATLLLLAWLGAGCRTAEDPLSAAPSPSESGSTPVVISYWSSFSGGDGRFMQEMVKAFNQSQSEVRVDQMNMKFDDYYARLQTSMVTDTAPDVAVIHSSRLPEFVPTGMLTELSDDRIAETRIQWKDYNRNIINSTVFDGKHYAVPLDIHTLVLYYNKSLLEKAGLLGPDGKPAIGPGEEGFLRFLNTIREKVPGVAPLAQPDLRIDSYWLWWTLYNQIEGGGAFYEENGTRSAIDNGKALKSLRFISDLYRTGLIPPHINDAFHLFDQGKAAVLITGTWGMGAFEHNPDLSFGVVPMPVIYDKPAIWGDSHNLVLPAGKKEDPRKQRAALLFADWMVKHGDEWAKAGHIPSSTGILRSEAFLSMPYRKDYAHSVEDVIYWPRHKRQWPVNDRIIQCLERMMYEGVPPEDTLQAMKKTVDGFLSPVDQVGDTVE